MTDEKISPLNRDRSHITHIGQALPQVAVHSVLVAVALQVSDDANLKSLRSEEVPQHIQNACTLKTKYIHASKKKEQYET